MILFLKRVNNQLSWIILNRRQKCNRDWTKRRKRVKIQKIRDRKEILAEVKVVSVVEVWVNQALITSKINYKRDKKGEILEKRQKIMDKIVLVFQSIPDHPYQDQNLP
jgi:hypothetical protein